MKLLVGFNKFKTEKELNLDNFIKNIVVNSIDDLYILMFLVKNHLKIKYLINY